MNGVLFTVCPWWDGPLVKDKIATQFADAAAMRLGKWIWIHHAPPANSPTSWGGARYFGDVELVQWIGQYRPDMVVCGHVHQSPFVHDGSWYDRIGATWVFNVGQQFGRPPAHIVLDFTTIPRSGCRPLASRSSISLVSGAARAIHRHAAGLAYNLIGFQIRAWRDVRRRQVDHALQEIADHRQMISLTGILPFDIG